MHIDNWYIVYITFSSHCSMQEQILFEQCDGIQAHGKVKQEATLGKGGVHEYCDNNNITAAKQKKDGNVSEPVTVQSGNFTYIR